MEKLKELFAGVNLSEFCEKYQLNYTHVRKVLKGTYDLTADLEQKLLQAYDRWLIEKREAFSK